MGKKMLLNILLPTKKTRK